MVVVSHLFFFLWKKLVRGAAHMSRPSHYLELSISRQPLFTLLKLDNQTSPCLIEYRVISFSIPASFA